MHNAPAPAPTSPPWPTAKRPTYVFTTDEKYLALLPDLAGENGYTTLPYSDLAPQVLLDFPMGTALHVLEAWPTDARRRTVVFTGNLGDTYADVLRSYHIGGVVRTTNEPHRLQTALETLKEPRETEFTYMQLRVLRRMLVGRANAEIAEELGISPKTVTSHLGRLLAAHDCPTRTELVACILTGARRG